MKRIVLATCGNGYCGCDAEDIFFFDENTPDTIVNEEVMAWAYDIAESYAYVHFGWGEHYTEEEYEDYIENYVSFNWIDATYDEYVEWCENWGYEVSDFN